MQELYGFFSSPPLECVWLTFLLVAFFFLLVFVSFSCRCSFITLSQRAHWISTGGRRAGAACQHQWMSACRWAQLESRFNLSPFRWKSTFRQDFTRTFSACQKRFSLWNSRERDPSNDTCTSNPIFPENEKLGVCAHTHTHTCRCAMFGGEIWLYLFEALLRVKHARHRFPHFLFLILAAL